MRPMISVVFLLAMLCGCASTQGPKATPAPPKLYYGTVNIFTDPPGVHIYSGGEYWGETGPNQPVVRIWWNTGRQGSTPPQLKRPG